MLFPRNFAQNKKSTTEEVDKTLSIWNLIERNSLEIYLRTSTGKRENCVVFWSCSLRQIAEQLFEKQKQTCRHFKTAARSANCILLLSRPITKSIFGCFVSLDTRDLYDLGSGIQSWIFPNKRTITELRFSNSCCETVVWSYDLVYLIWYVELPVNHIMSLFNHPTFRNYYHFQFRMPSDSIYYSLYLIYFWKCYQ